MSWKWISSFTSGKDTFRPDENDFIIVIMGPTGSGKTNLINHITGNKETGGARKLKSDTQQVTPYVIQSGGSRLVLVDTPGFDDTCRPDLDILKTIADWLTQLYANGKVIQPCGIIYLHRITDKRMSGSVYKNLQMFGRLCGNLPLRRARLVTTMWDTLRDQGMAENRERELINEFWKVMLAEGAVTKKFENTASSAWGIVNELMEKGNNGDKLLLQEELVKLQKKLNETEAAKVLYSQLQRLLVEQKKTLKELADEAKLQNDPSLAKSLQGEYDRINEQLEKTFEQMKEMKIPITRRIMLWLFGGKSNGKVIEI